MEEKDLKLNIPEIENQETEDSLATKEKEIKTIEKNVDEVSEIIEEKVETEETKEERTERLRRERRERTEREPRERTPRERRTVSETTEENIEIEETKEEKTERPRRERRERTEREPRERATRERTPRDRGASDVSDSEEKTEKRERTARGSRNKEPEIKLYVGSSPHLRSPETVSNVMRDVVITLNPTILLSSFFTAINIEISPPYPFFPKVLNTYPKTLSPSLATSTTSIFVIFSLIVLVPDSSNVSKDFASEKTSKRAS